MAINTKFGKGNRYTELFNRIGATDPEHAVTLQEIGIAKTYSFDRMLRSNVLVACKNNTYYINNQALEQYNEKMIRYRKLAAVVIVFLVIYIAIVSK